MKKILLLLGLAITLVYCNTPQPATSPNTTDTTTSTGTNTNRTNNADTTTRRDSLKQQQPL